jgi:hypothetical protein
VASLVHYSLASATVRRPTGEAIMFAHTIRNTFAAALLALSVVPATAFASEAGSSNQDSTVNRDERREWDRRWDDNHRSEWREDREAQRRYFERREAEWRHHQEEMREHGWR